MGKDIKVVKGDENEIEISPVYDHISTVKPKMNKEKKEQVVIPEEKKK